MRQSTFEKLTRTAEIENTKTLTKVTFKSISNFKILIKELEKEEEDYKVDYEKKLVIIKTRNLTSFLDLAEKIIAPSITSNPEVPRTLIREAFIEAGPASWLKRPPVIKMRRSKKLENTFEINLSGRVIGKDRIAKKLENTVKFLTLDQDVRFDSVLLDGAKFIVTYSVLNPTTRKPEKSITEYRILSIENSWGTRTFTLGKSKITDLTKTKSPKLNVKVGDKIHRSEYRWTRKTTTVSDCEHSQSVAYNMLQFKVYVFGIPIWLDAEQLSGIELDIAQFKLEEKPKVPKSKKVAK